MASDYKKVTSESNTKYVINKYVYRNSYHQVQKLKGHHVKPKDLVNKTIVSWQFL